MTLAVTGYRSMIIKELKRLIPSEEEVVRIDLGVYEDHIEAERWVLCAGAMVSIRGANQIDREVATGMRVNFYHPMTMCDVIFDENPKARVCVIGSESGYAGSYDDTYAAAKAAIHSYVERKKLRRPEQQLVAVAPSIIEDTGMTQRRLDQDNLNKRALVHPKQRFLKAVEVAHMVHFLLYVDEGYTTGTVIRMHGGGGA